MKTKLMSSYKLKKVTRKHLIIKKTVTKPITEYSPLSRELVPVYIEQVIGDPPGTEPSFHGPKGRT